MFWNTSQDKLEILYRKRILDSKREYEERIYDLENKCEELKHINHVLEYGYRDIINGLKVKIDDLKKENNKLKKENKKLKKKLKK